MDNIKFYFKMSEFRVGQFAPMRFEPIDVQVVVDVPINLVEECEDNYVLTVEGVKYCREQLEKIYAIPQYNNEAIEADDPFFDEFNQ